MGAVELSTHQDYELRMAVWSRGATAAVMGHMTRAERDAGVKAATGSLFDWAESPVVKEV